MDFKSRNITEKGGAVLVEPKKYYRYLPTGEVEQVAEQVLEDGTVIPAHEKEITKEIETTKGGDVYITITREAFDAPIPEDMATLITNFYPSLGDVKSLSDIFFVDVVRYDDEFVCFKTGIFSIEFEQITVPAVLDEDGEILEEAYQIPKLDGNGRKVVKHYTRAKNTSDFEFNMFMEVLANEDLSNIHLDNPYAATMEL